MIVKDLETVDEARYDLFLKKSPNSLFFASSKYKRLLTRFLNADPKYLLAIDDKNDIQGALPLMVKQSPGTGTVINSLPFYGSNGGIISDNLMAKQILLGKYKELIMENDTISATIVSSPFEPDNNFYETNMSVNFRDSRIGQITFFENSTSETLMDIFHYKTRNTIRKAVKEGVKVSWENGLNYIDFLCEVHKENMSKIGVAFKPRSFFEMLPESFEYGKEFRIYTAFYNDEPVAALLVFYFNRTVEYFTPVTIERFREQQPMSLLIYEAMRDSIANGYTQWNWGGTAQTQTGVYDFKKKWGTQDFIYFYFTTVCRNDLAGLSKERLLKEFPYFFVVPFNSLAQ